MSLMRIGPFELRRRQALPPAEKPAPQSDPKPPIGIKPAPLHTDPAKGNMTARYIGVMPNESPTLVQQKNKAGVGFRTCYGLLREIVGKDGRIAGLIQQRKTSVVRREMWWQDADISEEAQLCAEFMRECDNLLDLESSAMGGVYGDILQALDAPFYGIYVGKLTWNERELSPMTSSRERRRSRTFLVPTDVAQEDLDRVGFDTFGRLCIKANFADGEAAAQGFVEVPNSGRQWWYPHPLSYIVFNPYSQNDNPYGMALLEIVFYCAWLKRMVRVFHANFIERNTSPVFIVEQDTNSMGITDTQAEAIETAIDNIQQETGLRMPAGLKAKFLELMSNASAQAIESFERMCDYEAAAALVGQSSTSMTERSGSQSSAEVQERVADGIVAVDSLMLQSFRNQFMAMVLGYNLPHLRHKWPRFRVQIDSAQDLEKWMGVTEKYIQNGGEVTMRQAARKLGYDEKREGDALLKPLPAPYVAGPGGPPSQQRPQKTAQKRTERERQRPAQSQAQPRRTR